SHGGTRQGARRRDLVACDHGREWIKRRSLSDLAALSPGSIHVHNTERKPSLGARIKKSARPSARVQRDQPCEVFGARARTCIVHPFQGPGAPLLSTRSTTNRALDSEAPGPASDSAAYDYRAIHRAQRSTRLAYQGRVIG